MLNKIIIEFYFDLFERDIVPDIYSNILYSHNKSNICRSGKLNKNDLSKNNKVYLVKYVPEYLTPKLKIAFKAIKFFEIKGYAINLEGISTIEQYLKIQLKKKQRSSLINRKNRLEHCLNIRYEVYYNQISKETYSYLMSALHEFLVLRFEQRNETNQRLLEWDKYYELFFTLINNQRASFFAIYENDKPIALSLCYHLDKIFFGAISSYDINYSKFGLGQILVYKRLEWCINNNFMIYDMSMGNRNYKIKWCNMEYDFEHHIVYSSLSFRAFFYARLIALHISLKNYLKSKNIHLLYGKIKARFKRKAKIDLKLNLTINSSKYTIEPLEDLQIYDNLRKLDFNEVPYTFLKQSVCDFQYTTWEHISNIVNMEIEKDKSYVVKGNAHAHKVTFYDN
jgi:hypothetical protein